MPRQKMKRQIAGRPRFRGFTPEGIGPEDMGPEAEVSMTLEGFEAIRLIDYQGMGQAEAAEQMQVSRQTFGRILREARHALADALVVGKRLRVGGGCYEIRSSGQGGRWRRRGQGQGCGRGRRAGVDPSQS